MLPIRQQQQAGMPVHLFASATCGRFSLPASALGRGARFGIRARHGVPTVDQAIRRYRADLAFDRSFGAGTKEMLVRLHRLNPPILRGDLSWQQQLGFARKPVGRGRKYHDAWEGSCLCLYLYAARSAQV